MTSVKNPNFVQKQKRELAKKLSKEREGLKRQAEYEEKQAKHRKMETDNVEETKTTKMAKLKNMPVSDDDLSEEIKELKDVWDNGLKNRIKKTLERLQQNNDTTTTSSVVIKNTISSSSSSLSSMSSSLSTTSSFSKESSSVSSCDTIFEENKAPGKDPIFDEDTICYEESFETLRQTQTSDKEDKVETCTKEEVKDVKEESIYDIMRKIFSLEQEVHNKEIAIAKDKENLELLRDQVKKMLK